jgi:hypothetical protein
MKPTLSPAEGGADSPVGAAAPAPAPAPAEEPTAEELVSAGANSNNEEDVAAMLLSLQDEGGNNSGEVPEGSTVHDLTVGPDVLAGAEGLDPTSKKANAAMQAKAAAANNANTQAAAEAILKKYSRRTRKEP